MKKISSTGVFSNFSACNFTKNKTPAHLFSRKFCNILKNTCFSEHLRRFSSQDMIIARFFCKIYCSLKWKTERYQI